MGMPRILQRLRLTGEGLGPAVLVGYVSNPGADRNRVRFGDLEQQAGCQAFAKLGRPKSSQLPNAWHPHGRFRKGRHQRSSEAGYTLVMFVLVIAVMSIAMGVAVQTVSFQMQREREAELIFRGEQFIEAIRLYKIKYGRYPMQLKEIYEAKPRVLRKKWKDPITDSENWGIVFLGQEGGRPGQRGRQLAGPGAPGSAKDSGNRPIGTQTPLGSERQGGARNQPGSRGAGGESESGIDPQTGLPRSSFGDVGADRMMGPIVGVYSTSCDESIKIYEGHTTYCEWRFIFRERRQQRGARRPGRPPVGWHPGDELKPPGSDSGGAGTGTGGSSGGGPPGGSRPPPIQTPPP